LVGLPPATDDAVVVFNEVPDAVVKVPLVTATFKADVTVVFVPKEECVAPLIKGVNPI
jgi:hypothetical protein